MHVCEESGGVSMLHEATTHLFAVACHPQRGSGAVQITQVYSQFGEGDTLVRQQSQPLLPVPQRLPHPVSLCVCALQSLPQLCSRLPELGNAKAALLLETLVSRRLLRPFLAAGEVFWRRRHSSTAAS